MPGAALRKTIKEPHCIKRLKVTVQWNSTLCILTDTGRCLYFGEISKVQPKRCNVSSVYLFLQIALHVSGGSSVHHQEHKTVHTASGMVKTILLPAAIVDEMERSIEIYRSRKGCIVLVALQRYTSTRHAWTYEHQMLGKLVALVVTLHEYFRYLVLKKKAAGSSLMVLYSTFRLPDYRVPRHRKHWSLQCWHEGLTLKTLN